MRQTDYVILGLLEEGPLSGYDIKKIIDWRFSFFWNESFGQIFPSLKRLSLEGYICKLDEKENLRKKLRYKITDQGLKKLQEWLVEPVQTESLRLEILIKLYFSDNMDPLQMLEHIALFEQSHRRDLMILNAFEKELTSKLHDDVNHPTVLRVIDFGQKVNQAYIAWSEETKHFLKEKAKHASKNT